MAWRLVFTEQYNRRAAKFLRAHADSQALYAKTLTLLEANPYHPSLRLRSLKGKLRGLRSVSITMSYRITIELLITESEIVPINIGAHDEIYR